MEDSTGHFVSLPGVFKLFASQGGELSFISISEKPILASEPLNIFRQVLDKDRAFAESGMDGLPQIFDGRAYFAENQISLPIYRPKGAFCSVGPGEEAERIFAEQSVFEGETPSDASKKWYEIPNGSWFQSPFSIKSNESETFPVFQDKLQIYRTYCYSNRFSFSKYLLHTPFDAGSFPSYKIQRRILDGSLKPFNFINAETEILRKGKFAVCEIPASPVQQAILMGYSWYGTQKGVFYIQGSPLGTTPLIESRDPEHRHPLAFNFGDKEVFFSIGTDILKQWLVEAGLLADKCECTKVAFRQISGESKLLLYVYSEPESLVYSFTLDCSGGTVKPGLPAMVKTFVSLEDMSCLADGSLVMVSFEKRPAHFNNTQSEASGVTCNISYETSDGSDSSFFNNLQSGRSEVSDALSKHMFFDISGKLYYGNTYYLALHILHAGSRVPLRIWGDVFLGSEYFVRDFTLKAISFSELSTDASEIIKLAEKPGNSISPERIYKRTGQDVQRPQKLLVSSSIK